MTVLAVLPTSGSIATAQRLALGQGFLLASWNADGPDVGSPILPDIDGAPARPPYTTLTVRTDWGGQRVLSILRAPQPGSHVRFVAQGRVIAEAWDETDPADLDPTTLLGSLDAAARLRVVRFVLDFARSTPTLRGDARFAQLCRRMVLSLSPTPSALAIRAMAGGGDGAGDGLLLCSGSLSARFGAVTGAMVVTPGAVGPAPFEICVGTDGGHRGRVPMDLLIDRDLCAPGNLLVVLGANGLACRAFSAPPATLPTLTEHLAAHRDAPLALRRSILRGLARRGAADAAAASTLREIQVLVPLPKRQLADARRSIGASLDVAVPTGDGGLFLAGWIHDPHGLVAGFSVQPPFGEERRLDALEHRFPREDVAKLYGTNDGEPGGFVAYLPGTADAAPGGAVGLQVSADLRLKSGGSIRLVPPPRPQSDAEARAAVLGSLPPRFATPDVLERVIAPAVAPLHAAHLATRTAPETVVFGDLPRNPAVSVIIPLYKTLEFLRFQLAGFATDPGMAGAELIFVLDSPEQRDELVHLMQGLHGLYGLPMRLLVQSANFGYSAANNAGVAAARGRDLLFLNSDVIPDRAGWLAALTAALRERPGTGAVGPKLLFDDDSLQHAGLYFDRDLQGRWFNHHYAKGLPRDFAAACRPRSVPGVTGACLLMPRAVFEAVGGFCEDYVIGDFEDSDLCLRVRSAGLDIRYTPAVELYHLERRSIGRHQGYTRGVASEYNCWLHARRWAPLMAELMARPWEEDGPAPSARASSPPRATSQTQPPRPARANRKRR